jgi:hypothetical protein
LSHRGALDGFAVSVSLENIQVLWGQLTGFPAAALVLGRYLSLGRFGADPLQAAVNGATAL